MTKEQIIKKMEELVEDYKNRDIEKAEIIELGNMIIEFDTIKEIAND